MPNAKLMTDEELQNMTLQDAAAKLSRRVYDATRLIEEIEYKKASDGCKRIRANGHHLRQEIAAFAVKLLREEWED